MTTPLPAIAASTARSVAERQRVEPGDGRRWVRHQIGGLFAGYQREKSGDFRERGGGGVQYRHGVLHPAAGSGSMEHNKNKMPIQRQAVELWLACASTRGRLQAGDVELHHREIPTGRCK